VRRFGSKAYFGSSTRIDLLRAVGADDAKIIVIALADPAEALKVVELVQAEFPHLRIFARARNRRHAHVLMDLKVETVVRETFFSSLRLTELVLGGLGLKAEDARHTVQVFREHDEKALVEQHSYYQDEKQLIQTAEQAAIELRELFETDRGGKRS
jgi:voltage-gated potassium channel Kch